MTDTTKSARKSWTKVAFGDVVQLARERSSDPEADGHERFIGLEHIDPGDLRVRRWGNIADGVTFTNVFKPGQVLFGKRRAYQRKVAVADFGGVCSSDIYVLEPKGEGLLPELLPFICQTDAFFEHAVGTSAGSLSPRTNWDSLASFEFALPLIEEQRRLSRVLVAADAVWHSLDRLADQLKAVRQSLIDECSSVADDSIRLGELCQMQNGRPFPGDEYCESGLPLLRPGNLGADGYFDWSDEKTKRVPHHYATEATSFLVRRGDIVINLTAQSLDDGFMGRVCMATGSGPSLLNQRIGRFVDFSALILPEFLFRCLQSSRFVAHAAAMCEGSKIKHLFWPHIACFELPRLSTAVQAASCKRLLELDLQIRTAHERSAAAAQLRAHALDSAWRRGAEAIA